MPYTGGSTTIGRGHGRQYGRTATTGSGALISGGATNATHRPGTHRGGIQPPYTLQCPGVQCGGTQLAHAAWAGLAEIAASRARPPRIAAILLLISVLPKSEISPRDTTLKSGLSPSVSPRRLLSPYLKLQSHFD